MTRTDQCCDRSAIAPRLVGGLALLAIGVLFTLDTLDILEAEGLLIYWPIALIAIGLTRLFSRRIPDLVFALSFIGLGTWFLLYNFDYTDLEPWEFFWPIVLILVGVHLVLGAFGRRLPAHADAHSTVRAFAFWSGIERQNNSPAFLGGDLTAIMGGCELDLRQAKLGPEGAVLHLFTLWGGIEIRVPPEWSVDSRVLPLMGGYSDSTDAPVSADGPRLTIRGSAIMGGIEVKN